MNQPNPGAGAHYPRDNDGALFRNDYKRTDRDPDYTGTATVNGQRYRVSAWLNVMREGSVHPGRRYLKISFTSEEELAGRGAGGAGAQPRGAPVAAPAPAPVEDIPFSPPARPAGIAPKPWGEQAP